MLLSMMLILATTSALLELMIAAKIPAWRRLAGKSPLFNLLNSLVISFIVGLAFGGSGLVAMGAGVISTILTVPGYALLKWAYDSPQAAQRGGNQLKYYSDKTKTVTKDTLHLIYKILRIITFPIWASRSILEKLQLYMNKYRAFKARHISRNQA
jgi:hypothetical protein